MAAGHLLLKKKHNETREVGDVSGEKARKRQPSKAL
jgi:hypothetical protein